MAFSYKFDNVVSQISKQDARSFVPANSRRLILIDRNNGTEIKKAPLFGVGANVAYYVVYNTNDPAHVAESSITNYVMNDFPKGLRLSLSIQYRVTCPPGMESKAVLALFNRDDNYPGKVFEDCIIRCLNTFWEENYPPQNSQSTLEAFCMGGFQGLDNLCRSVESQIKFQTGLSVQIRIQFDNESKLISQELDGNMQIMVCDSEERVELHYKANLEVDPAKKMIALLHYTKLHTLEDDLKNEIKTWMREQATLENLVYFFDLKIRQLLTQHLNDLLIKYGHRLHSLSVKTDSKLRMPILMPLKHDVNYKVTEYGDVLIENELQVAPDTSKLVAYRNAVLADPGRFVNIQKVFETYLDTIVADEMFGCTYLDILLRFDTTQQKIKVSMERMASAIGYKVNLITSVPDLEPLRWKKDGFTIETAKLRDEYATRFNNVKVKLNVIVSGKLRDLSKIETLLNRKADVLEVMSNKIVERVALKLHGTDPEYFYVHFDYPFEETGRRALKEEIQLEITDLLKKEFGVNDISVIAKMLDTELTDRINKLLNEKGEFTIEGMRSLRDLNTPITLIGRFRVEGVVANQWHTFQNRSKSMEDIQDYLKFALAARLKTLPTGAIVYQDTHRYKEFCSLLNQLAREVVADEFGLTITVSSLDRQETDQEQDWGQAQINDRSRRAIQYEADMQNAVVIKTMKSQPKLDSVNSITEELAKIRQRIQELVILDPTNDEEVRKLEERVKQLEMERDSNINRLSEEHFPQEPTPDSLAPHYERLGASKNLPITSGDGFVIDHVDEDRK